MEIMTIVSGKIPPSIAKNFESAYESLKNGPFTPGLVRTRLLRSAESPGEYRIETIWESLDALEKMRRSAEIPKAVELFIQFGSKPIVAIFEIAQTFP